MPTTDTSEVVPTPTAEVATSLSIAEAFEALSKQGSSEVLTVAQSDDSDRKLQADATQRALETERKGREEYFKLRTQWSWFAFILLMTMILFQIVLIIGLGRNALVLKDHDLLLKMVIVENFLQIVGIALIVVRFLFPSVKDEP